LSPLADGASIRGMAWVPGGQYSIGSADFYPEERPVHRVQLGGFWIDVPPVTNAEFRRFVKATGHVTVAECAPDAADYPDTDPALLVPGSLVFRKPALRVPLAGWRTWWAWTPGAHWRRPRGPGSTLHGLERHPVVHVAYADALAYAHWAGKDLPTEAEWETAARGGLDGATYAWGNEVTLRGRPMANTWAGEFPWQDLKSKGYGTTPAGSFPPNRYGLYDMTGNVWEWTRDFYTSGHSGNAAASCCIPRNPRVDAPAEPGGSEPGAHIPRKVIKGGSYLCAPNYCLRYRPAARQAEAVDTSTGHLGFRCVVRPGPG
jgi:formylglycine-generating enzyme required for sulfatase activity